VTVGRERGNQKRRKGPAENWERVLKIYFRREKKEGGNKRGRAGKEEGTE